MQLFAEFASYGDQIERRLQVTFEGGFADSERAASAATKSVHTLAGVLKQLEKAAAKGEIAAMRKAAERASIVLQSVTQDVENATTAWPFSPDAEESYLRDSYSNEIMEKAKAEGIPIQRLDDGYLAYPSILRIIPSERAVTVDRKLVRTIRPSLVLKTLKTIQTAKPKLSPEQFVELLHRSYEQLVGKEYGRTLALSTIYDCLTLLPGSASAYAKSDFARDLFVLDRSGVTKTRSGATISLPASTGTKGGRGTFSFVSPQGEPVTYYGIQFEGGMA
jgi:hypothetical protein